jgi:hypothetical protein
MRQRNHAVQQSATGNRSIQLSLDDYTNYKTCAGFAWLARHRPHLVPDETDLGKIRRTRAGDELEIVARTLFPGGLLIDNQDPHVAAELTRQAAGSGASTLFQATVCTGRGLLAQADVLTRLGDQWLLSEVRAATSIRTEHVIEAGYQYFALKEAGFDIAGVRLVHLDKAFRRSGEVHQASILVSTDITSRVVKHLATIERDVDRALGVLQDTGRTGVCLCDMGTRNQRCPTFSHFHPDLPAGNTVYDLGGISARKLGEVLARGIVHLVDWPDDIEVMPRQRQQIDVQRRGEPHVDAAQIRSFLDKLEPPFHFLDYETFQTAIPLFDGCGPWSQVPFQYSLHVANEAGVLDHQAFLWTERQTCPVPALIDHLRSGIGPTGSVIVWNKGFEESRNREMAEMVPSAASFFNDINERMVDLMDIVRKGAWVHPEFNGSSSIKKVLPVATPGLSYDQLAIGDGALASERWFAAVMGDPEGMTDAERMAVFESLRTYSELDTLAMVHILEHLRDLVGSALAVA